MDLSKARKVLDAMMLEVSSSMSVNSMKGEQARARNDQEFMKDIQEFRKKMKVYYAKRNRGIKKNSG